MIGAGTFINPLLKIITTVVILGAIYLLFVKPILNTTEDAFNTVGPAIQQAQRLGGPQIDRSIRQAQRLQQNAQQASQTQLQEAHKLLNCIQQANGNIDKIQACNAKYQP
jgi:F0F1-type ATP synthase membrane subunit b/b'